MKVHNHDGLASGRTEVLPDCQDIDNGRFSMGYPLFVGVLDYILRAV